MNQKQGEVLVQASHPLDEHTLPAPAVSSPTSTFAPPCMWQPLNMDDTHRIYENILSRYMEWADLPRGPHFFCPKVNDDDGEDYDSPGPPITDITPEEKRERIQCAQRRKALTYDLSLLLGIDQETVGDWIHDWTTRVNACLTNCDSCILAYHMQRKPFLKTLREYVTSL